MANLAIYLYNTLTRFIKIAAVLCDVWHFIFLSTSSSPSFVSFFLFLCDCLSVFRSHALRLVRTQFAFCSLAISWNSAPLSHYRTMPQEVLGSKLTYDFSNFPTLIQTFRMLFF